MALVVDPQGGKGERHRRCGVERHRAGIVDLGSPNPFAGGGFHVPDSAGAGQLDQGGEPLGHLFNVAPEAGKAVEHGLQHGVHQGKDHIDQQIQNAVKGGQRQNVSGEHGAEHREGVEKQGGYTLNQQPYRQRVQVQTAVHGLHCRRHQKDCQMGQKDEGQAGEVVGDKQGVPVQGKGVHHAGRAGEEQVAEHRHGGCQTHCGRQGYPGLQHI